MRNAVLFTLFFIKSTHSLADWQPDKVNLAFGSYLDSISSRQADIAQYRLGVVWDLSDSLWESEQLLLQSYAELAFGYWDSQLNFSSSQASNEQRVGATSVKQVSLTPVFRLTSADSVFLSAFPFFDIGVGASYQDEADIEQQHISGINMGGNWQFEIRTFVGLALGAQKQFEVSLGWMHYSNANTRNQNEGLDFKTLQLGYRF